MGCCNLVLLIFLDILFVLFANFIQCRKNETYFCFLVNTALLLKYCWESISDSYELSCTHIFFLSFYLLDTCLWPKNCQILYLCYNCHFLAFIFSNSHIIKWDWTNFSKIVWVSENIFRIVWVMLRMQTFWHPRMRISELRR